MKTIYLAGPISGHYKKGAMSWREEAASWISDLNDGWGYDYIVRDPLRGKGFDKFRGKIKDAYDGAGPLRTEQAIFYRDFNDVFTCDLVLANFTDTAVRKVTVGGSSVKGEIELASIGTVMELGWAWAYRKPVVLVLPKNNVHDHTFIKRTATVIVETLDEALELVPEILG
jgi:nucleoside 2-deoxyribosyltransferase